MSRVILDIETLGFPLDAFDDVQQDYLLRFAQTEEQRKETMQKFSLYPTTARVIAIGMWNPDTLKGRILLNAEEKIDEDSADGTARFSSADEKTILGQFWEDVAHYDQFITFNGRGFDCPFLMLRSAMLEVKPTRNLMPYRYESTVHCDLLDQLTFYGAMRKFNLDFYCKAFAIESPKAHGITGLDLGAIYEKGEFRRIAEYCLGDLHATAELFRRWNEYIDV